MKLDLINVEIDNDDFCILNICVFEFHYNKK